ALGAGPPRGGVVEGSALEQHGHHGLRLLCAAGAAQQGHEIRGLALDLLAVRGQGRPVQGGAQQGEPLCRRGGHGAEPLHEGARLAVSLGVEEIVDPVRRLAHVAGARQRQLRGPQSDAEAVEVRQLDPVRALACAREGGGSGGHHRRNLPSARLSAHSQHVSVQCPGPSLWPRAEEGPVPIQQKRCQVTVDAEAVAASPAPPRGSPDPHAAMPVTGRFAGHLHFDGSIAPVLHTEVDVAAYVRRGTARLPVDTAQVEAEGPLGDEVRLTLGVLQRLEGSSLTESRAMLSTATGNEARITAFLATWQVDRFWQSRALRDLLTGDHPTAR